MGSSLPLVAMVKLRHLAVVLALSLASVDCHVNPLISVCPGEGARYGDFKCIHDRTHRVCARLVEDAASCTALSWGALGRTFWQLTGQQEWEWSSRICRAPNPGNSWCICMWATASLIAQVGCENVHIDCAATDVNWVKRGYREGGWDLQEAKECLDTKCQRRTDGRYVNRSP